MSRLNLKIRSVTGANPIVTLDGKKVKLKKNKFGNYDANLDVEDGARLRLVCWDTILSPFWLLWEMLFFVISVFGIFDNSKDKLRRAAEFEAVLHPGENAEATLTFIRSKGEGSVAAELTCNFDAEVEKNEYYGFETVNKRRKIALAIKIAIWVALIASVIVVVANTFGK